MKIIKPSFEIINEFNTLKLIELAGRVTHKSEHRITDESAKAFVSMLIKKKHLSVLEHGALSFVITDKHYELMMSLLTKIHPLKFFKFSNYLNDDDEVVHIVSANYRALLEYFYEVGDKSLYKYCMKKEPFVFKHALLNNHEIDVFDVVDVDVIQMNHFDFIYNKHTRATIKFVIDRGVSHELVRHRECAFTQESTRYVNYKNNGMVVILPEWEKTLKVGNYTPILTKTGIKCNEISNQLEIGKDDAIHLWFWQMLNVEVAYTKLLTEGWKPQQVRSILPNSLKTEIFVTASLSEWHHIFTERVAKAAHPQMREVMRPLLDQMKLNYTLSFNNINYE